MILCCGRIARRICLAFVRPARLNGFILDSYSLRGSTNETLQRHVSSEDNISVSVWRVFNPSRVSPETRCERFRGFVDSVMI